MTTEFNKASRKIEDQIDAAGVADLHRVHCELIQYIQTWWNRDDASRPIIRMVIDYYGAHSAKTLNS